MKILGVRSFDHRTGGETINFEGPLTLIVGFNGSGKTTIVECLKYVTTGQLPPNSKGGAFIHDPKLTGDKEVKAQIKLQFKNASGHQMVITRSLELTVKKSAVTQRAVDSSLLLKHNGERVALSTKVAELDKIVPESLGVSPAILDNVIFCHQDDSLWPMSEPMKLKLKFDQIFEAQKYTSAIESITKLRKSHNTNLGQLQIHEKHAKELKDTAEKKHKKMGRLQAEIEDLRVRSEVLGREMEQSKALSAEKTTKLNEALGIVSQLNVKTEQVKGLQYTLQSLKDDPSFVELKESDDWLQSTLDQYDARMGQYAKQQEKYNARYKELQAEVAATRQKMDQKQAERGQYQAEKESYEKQIQNRVQLVKEAARSHSLRGYDGDLDEKQVHEFVGRVQRLLQEKDRELDRVRKSTDDDLRQSRDVLARLENRQATRTQEKVTAGQTITANERKIKLRQDEIVLIKTDEGARAALEASLNETQEDLQKAQADFNAASWDQTLKIEKDNLQELELEAKRLRDELVRSTNLASDLAALEYAKKEAKNAQRSLDAMIATYNQQLTNVIGADWRPETIEREFQTLLDQKDQVVSEAKKQQEGADRELRDQAFKLKTAKSSLKQKTEEMQKCEAAVLGSILTSEGTHLSSVSQYLEELKLLEKSRNELQKDLDGMSTVRDYYTKGLEIIAEKNCCRLCVRPFTDNQEKIAASKRLQASIDKLVRGEIEEELKEVEQDLRSAQAVRAQSDTYQRLSEIEIPSLEKDIKQLEVDKARLDSKCEARDRVFNDEVASKRDVEALANNIGDIVKYHTQISKHQEEITRISSQQKFSGSSMTVDEIQEKSAMCDERIQVIKNKIDKLTTDRQLAISNVADLEKDFVNLSHKLREAQHQLDKRRDIQTAIDELRSDINQQRQAISRADLDLESMIPDFTKAKTQDEETRRRGDTKLKHIQAEKDNLAQTVNKLNMVETAINDYVENGGPGKLTACERAIKNLENDHDRIDTEISQVTKTANELKSTRDNGEKTQRNIRDNIRYRKSVRDLNTVKGEISDLEGRNAEDEADRFKKELVSADKNYQNLAAERGPVAGSMVAKDAELTELIQEFNEEYQHAAEEYREMHIKVETTKAAIEDMGKCSLALENAIMKFHTLKMEEINAIAAELWRTTYQGSDVDTIMIKSENETASINAHKRNYNYRVVMVKSDTEMDMRGRCSAGQRVLASIIIRLALAECFGANCGVIALDEPTTNLDRDNIIALAKSLHAIIKARKHQSNFQLIIITHDEEFLKHMQCTDFCDNYWRVGRNAEQKSTIERQSLADFA